MAKTSSAVKNRWNAKHYSQIGVQLPKELVAEFKKKCKETGKSQAAVIREAIEKFLEE